MRVRIVSKEIGIDPGTECDVVAIYVVSHASTPWHFYIDEGNVCQAASLADVEIVDPSTDGFRFFVEPRFREGGILLLDVLADHPEVFAGLQECYSDSYAEFQRLKRDSRRSVVNAQI
jgi:hypothetical protein